MEAGNYILQELDHDKNQEDAMQPTSSSPATSSILLLISTWLNILLHSEGGRLGQLPISSNPPLPSFTSLCYTTLSGSDWLNAKILGQFIKREINSLCQLCTIMHKLSMNLSSCRLFVHHSKTDFLCRTIRLQTVMYY